MNIAEILKKCPKGTKLYSPVFGEVELEDVRNEQNFSIYCKTEMKVSTPLQAMVGFTSSIPMLNVYSSHPKTNAIGVSLSCPTQSPTQSPTKNINSNHLRRCLCE